MTSASAMVADPVRNFAGSNREAITVYPNPAIHSITLKYSSASTGRSYVNIYDVTGASVKKILFQKETAIHQQQIDVSALVSGLYYIEVMTGNSRANTKLIKR